MPIRVDGPRQNKADAIGCHRTSVGDVPRETPSLLRIPQRSLCDLEHPYSLTVCS